MPKRLPERILVRRRGDADWSSKDLVPSRPNTTSQVQRQGSSAEQLQRLVKGRFAALPIGLGFVLICNEEGELLEMSPCIGLPRGPGREPLFVVGPVAIVRASGTSYVGMTEDEEHMVRTEI